MCKYEMDPTSIVEDTERTAGHHSVHRRADGRTDGRRETSIPPFNFVEAGGIIYIIANLRWDHRAPSVGL